MTKPIYAVLTGDLVESSRLKPRELAAARDQLLSAVQDVRLWNKKLVEGKSEFFRGDSWQVLLTDPAYALRVALFFRARMKAQGIVDTRIAIGMGSVSSIEKNKVSLSGGEAFILSGHALDGLNQMLRHMPRVAIALPPKVEIVGRLTRIAIELCDALVSQWKQRQAETVAFNLVPGNLSQEEIAQQMKLSRQAVTKSLQGANWSSIKQAIEEFEQIDWAKVCHDGP